MGRLSIAELWRTVPPRRRLAVLLGLGVSCAASIALLLLPIDTSSRRVPTLAALATISVLALCNEVVVARYERAGTLKDQLRLDATGVIALVGLWLGGPLVGVLASTLPELPRKWRGAERLKFLPRTANYASFATATLAAAGVLALFGRGAPARAGAGDLAALPALAVAGIVWFATNYIVTRGLVAMLADGQPVRATIRREFVPALPSVLAMVGCAAATSLITADLGPVGLTGVLLAVTAPQFTLAVIAWCSPPAAMLNIASSRARYAAALADELGLSRRQRKIVTAAARGEMVSSFSGEPVRNWYDVGAARFYEHERFDGRGEFGLAGVMIPLESRVLAVADAWARLTATGTLTMTQRDAVSALERHQPRYDPRVVSAARSIIDATLRAPTLQARVPAQTTLARRCVAHLAA